MLTLKNVSAIKESESSVRILPLAAYGIKINSAL